MPQTAEAVAEPVLEGVRTQGRDAAAQLLLSLSATV